jgi:hypothetical protein
MFVGGQGPNRAIGPPALQWVSPQRALRLASSIGGLANGGTDRLIFGMLSHEQIGKTRAYVITKWRQSEIQQVKETKVPPPRTHGKVGEPVGAPCSAVRQNTACKVGAAVAAAEHAPSPTPSMDNGSFRACLPWSFAPCLVLEERDLPLTAKPVYQSSGSSRNGHDGFQCSRPSGRASTVKRSTV